MAITILKTSDGKVLRSSNSILQYNPIPIYSVKYGLLYNWYAATDSRKISSSDDWGVPQYALASPYFTIIGYAGGASVAGGKLKESGTNYWTTGNTGTNDYGFNMRGGGERSITGAFSNINNYGTLIPLNQASASSAWQIRMTYNSDTYSIFSTGKNAGSSVRLTRAATGVADGVTGTYTGNDGKVYRTVVINQVEWLADNLCETRFRNGDIVPYHGVNNGSNFTNAEWAALTTAGCCAYNNTLSNVATGFTFPT